jgi:hypothetical protein
MEATMTLPMFYNEQDTGGDYSPDHVRFKLKYESISDAVEALRRIDSSVRDAARIIIPVNDFELFSTGDNGELVESGEESTAYFVVYYDGDFVIRGGCNTDFHVNWETEMQPSPLFCCDEEPSFQIITDIDNLWQAHEKPFIICKSCGDKYPNQYGAFVGIEIESESKAKSEILRILSSYKDRLACADRTFDVNAIEEQYFNDVADDIINLYNKKKDEK